MAVSSLHRVPLRRCEEASRCEAAGMLSLFQELTLSMLKYTFGHHQIPATQTIIDAPIN